MRTDTTPTVWVDVEDLFHHLRFNPRPSGIQRMAFEIGRELRRMAGPRVRFVRRGPDGGGALLHEAAWTEVEDVFGQAASGPAAASVAGPDPRLAARRRAKAAIHLLPPSLREPLLRAAVLQSQAARQAHEAWRAARRERRTQPRAAPPAAASGGAPVRAGDNLLVLGAPWAVPGFPALAAALKARHGLSLAVLFYDLVPVRHPEWCTRHATELFGTWLDATLPLCDRLLAISRHTAGDVGRYARERAIPLAGPVTPVPVGTAFGEAAAARPRGLPQPGTYVLFVSTLEARKNHALLVRVWQRLVDEVRRGVRAADSVPQLVFAGRVGWLVDDLLQQLDNMAWLKGRVRLVRDPTDAEVRALYEGCLFTVFPSLFEGWGLPVSESMAHGKPCLASSAAALPEAGGGLCRHFDPEDTGAAHRAVAALLDDPAVLPAWTASVQAGFRPVPWANTARTVLASLGEGAA